MSSGPPRPASSAASVTPAPVTPAQASGTPLPTTIDNGLARTPVMGFNDWNAFGCDVSARLIEQTAAAMVANGMKAAGYDYVNIDDCWMARGRDAAGHLVPDPVKFPDGIAAVAASVHAMGLKLGIYESAGAITCEKFPGSLGHETTDANDFAAWGVDLLKYDNCGTPSERAGTQARYLERYTTMAQALQATGRPIVYSICEWGWRDAPSWAPAISNMWRTTRDITDSYASMLSIVKHNATLASAARPGAFNDPDMLEVGNGGMTETEQRSEFSLWAIMAAPLIAGTDLRSASPATLAIYTNADVIAVDQDALGLQGSLLTSRGGLFVFAKPLVGGDVAVALFNSSDHTERMSTTATAVGIRSAVGSLTLTDLWSKQVTTTTDAITAVVPAHATVLYRVRGGGVR
ncbi:glycoside hydrolase family 27 protein [Rathayibacter soli]|uniref:glycoside hydrolase family 27 protein n=1 Tax=Rathayibacter soli TaxID=3144168 RepID=UPI0027E4EB83|nr:glycoside hydrolase family 27 protein [Glaciibacter superstes]